LSIFFQIIGEKIKKIMNCFFNRERGRVRGREAERERGGRETERDGE